MPELAAEYLNCETTHGIAEKMNPKVLFEGTVVVSVQLLSSILSFRLSRPFFTHRYNWELHLLITQ